ncbi:MAG: S1 RNA-binding domain-containing protein [Oscillospiraceae bacterium]|nr:S1 RNA-binding domain-containing protein [Oscillospiraceae bacterium]MDE6005872.1 S1 RNA-binding domain-containing protein [Oscillospiraceae bacterium]
MLEIGKIYDGKVKGITNYGAFVEVLQEGEKFTGMVHISEVANIFVNDIREFLTEGQEVKVTVLQVNEQGKISMSIKKALPKEEKSQQRFRENRQNRPNRQARDKGIVWEGMPSQKSNSEMSFEDMMTHFKQNSEERISDIKRITDRKTRSRRRAK